MGRIRDDAVLAAIADLTKPKGPTTGQIAVAVQRSRRGVRYTIDRLVAAGLVAEADRGGNHVTLTLTNRGHAALEESLACP